METDMPPSPVPPSNQHPNVSEQDSTEVDKTAKKGPRPAPRGKHTLTQRNKVVTRSVSAQEKGLQQQHHNQKQPGNRNDIRNLVMKVIKRSKDTSGTSARDIKKYLAAKYNVDVKAQGPDILMSLKSGVKTGHFVMEGGKYKAAAKKGKGSKKSPEKGKKVIGKSSGVQKSFKKTG